MPSAARRLPIAYSSKLVKYNDLLTIIKPSAAFLRFNDAYFHFMILRGEDFSNFASEKMRRVQRALGYDLTDADLGMLREEYEKVRESWMGIERSGPSVPTGPHGMTISSAFNDIDKEAQQRKAEEIRQRNHSQQLSIPTDEVSRCMYEMAKDMDAYVQDFLEDAQGFVDRLLEPDYEVTYHFADTIEELHDHYSKDLELVYPHKPINVNYEEESDISTSCDDDDIAYMDQDAVTFVGNVYATKVLTRDIPRWRVNKVNSIEHKNFRLPLRNVEKFSNFLGSDKLILYDLEYVSLHKYDLANTRQADAIDYFDLDCNSLQTSDNEDSSENGTSCGTSYVEEMLNQDPFTDFRWGDLIEFAIVVDIHRDDELIEQYCKIMCNLVRVLFPMINNVRRMEDVGIKARVMKDYVSNRLGTDKFFNFSISKKSAIYKKYRKMGIRPPLSRSYTFNADKMADWMVVRPRRRSMSDRELALLQENPVFTVYAFLYATTRMYYTRESPLCELPINDDFQSMLTRGCGPLGFHKLRLNISYLKCAVETLNIWKKHNISFNFIVHDRDYADDADLKKIRKNYAMSKGLF